ncbi:MAG TPA: DUF357 domain-containing protein [Candidatus Nanoarchaeia archaeon]|nr:DUF357 domain-containing protein [Candidatus Nanoarchaeia archaeon]
MKSKSTVNVVTDERLAKYFDYTKRALAEASAAINSSHAKIAAEFLDMASRYYSDAGHFKSKGDVVTAFAALNYAHGWLDAGARAGFFLVTNNELFVVD